MDLLADLRKRGKIEALICFTIRQNDIAYTVNVPLAWIAVGPQEVGSVHTIF